MAENRSQLSPQERELLRRTTRSRQAAHGLVTRAQLVLDCAEYGVTEAARRSSVGRRTAAKWWSRYGAAGLDGLHDIPRTGRPSTSQETVRRVLRCVLDEPPAGSGRWTTRVIADATGLSQATVSRIRRRHFPKPRTEPESDFLSDNSTSILAYVDVHSTGCALGFHPAGGVSTRTSALADQADVAETIVCSALLRSGCDDRSECGNDGSGDAVALLRRAAERLPSAPAVTLIVDVELDADARRWLAQHRELTVRALPGERWLAMVHRLAESLDPRQLHELRDVQRRIRQAHRDGAGGFCWLRTADQPPAPGGTTAPATSALQAREVTRVVRGICAAIEHGELRAGQPIAVRSVARRSGMSPGRAAEALSHLADEALVGRSAGMYLVPAPTSRDVIETYTARGLLGTAICRRLASARIEPPSTVDECYDGLVRCNELGRTLEACWLDLDLQDELARAADLPRIGSMFIRLTLQLRIFVTIFGLSFRCPIGEILSDYGPILEGIRRHDPEAAAQAWRSKVDNCARYMLSRLHTVS